MSLFFKNSVNKKELIVLISKIEVIYFFKNQKKKNTILIDSTDIFDYSDKLKNIIEQKILKNIKEEDFIDFYFIEENFVFVPEKLFFDDLSNDYLSLISPIYNYDMVLNSKIEKPKATIVFSILKDIEFFIEKKVKQFKFNHIGARTINRIIPTNKKEQIYCVFYKNYAEILFYKEQKIKLYNLINFNSLNELLKELITKIEFNNFDSTTLELKLVQYNSNQKKFFKTYFRNVNE